MKNVNQEQERRVWERVVRQSGESAPDRELEQLARIAAENAAGYRDLAREATGKQKEDLLALMEGEKRNVETLQGAAAYRGETLNVSYPPSARDSGARILRRSIRRCRELYIGFVSREAETELGPVFQTLADRERKHMALTMELLGSYR